MRLRREPEPSPETVRALAALDAALAGDTVAPERAELRDLARAVRAERPRPRPEFELALDLRAHEGFPPADRPGIHKEEPARRKELHTPHRLRTTPLALGTAAAIFIVATAVLTSGLLGGDGGGGKDKKPTELYDVLSPSTPSGRAAQEKAAGGASAAVPALSQDRTAAPPATRRRQVERSAELELTTPRDQIEDVADGVIRVTDRHGGFVLRSSVSGGDKSDAGASLFLRIPSTQLQATIADLSELAHVRSRTQSSRDVTAQFSSPRRRLADALAERRGLLRQLARAVTPNETAAVRARLRAANRRADRARAELRRLHDRVRYSSVAVSVAAGAAGKDDGGWSLGDAAHDAVSVLRAVAGAAIVGLAVAVPAGFVAFLGWLAYRAVLRRRREQALDATSVAPPAAAD